MRSVAIASLAPSSPVLEPDLRAADVDHETVREERAAATVDLDELGREGEDPRPVGELYQIAIGQLAHGDGSAEEVRGDALCVGARLGEGGGRGVSVGNEGRDVAFDR